MVFREIRKVLQLQIANLGLAHSSRYGIVLKEDISSRRLLFFM